jgi:hypothetical protein
VEHRLRAALVHALDDVLGDRIANAVQELVGRPHVGDGLDGKLADGADARADRDQRTALLLAVLRLAVF